jgi:hypothetical protein
MGVNALALAFSVKDISFFIIMGFILNNKFGFFKDRKLYISILKVFAATIVMICAIMLARASLPVLVTMTIGILVFIVAALLLKSEEVEEAKAILRNYFAKT